MIATKQQMYRELKNGRLGNCLRNWNSLGALMESGYTGLVGVRATTASCVKAASLDNVLPRELEGFMFKHGLHGRDLMISEGAPDERLTIQGEVMRRPDGLVLRFSAEKTKMRIALERSIHVRGITAVKVLKQSLTPASYDDLMDVLDEHDNGPTGKDTVVEFSAYQMPLGHARGRNMIVWEVRSY